MIPKLFFIFVIIKTTQSFDQGFLRQNDPRFLKAQEQTDEKRIHRSANVLNRMNRLESLVEKAITVLENKQRRVQSERMSLRDRIQVHAANLRQLRRLRDTRVSNLRMADEEVDQQQQLEAVQQADPAPAPADPVPGAQMGEPQIATDAQGRIDALEEVVVKMEERLKRVMNRQKQLTIVLAELEEKHGMKSDLGGDAGPTSAQRLADADTDAVAPTGSGPAGSDSAVSGEMKTVNKQMDEGEVGA